MGYFVCFILEFLDLEAESRLISWILPVSLTRVIPHWIKRGLSYLTTTLALGYAMIPFELLHWGKIVKVWSSVFWFGHVGIVLIMTLDSLLGSQLRGKGSKKIKGASKKEI